MARTALALLLVAACAAPRPTFAAGCGQFFRQRAYVQPVQAYYQPTYYAQAFVQPQVYYRAGIDVEAEALAEKVARKVAEKLQAQVLQQTAKADATNVLNQYCGDCHSSAAPKKGRTYEAGFAIPAQHVTDALREIRDGTMPPPKSLNEPLSNEVKGALMEALLSAEVADDGGLE